MDDVTKAMAASEALWRLDGMGLDIYFGWTPESGWWCALNDDVRGIHVMTANGARHGSLYDAVVAALGVYVTAYFSQER